LRPWRDSDARALARACLDPEIPRWTSVPANYTEADARNYLQRRHDWIAAGEAAPFAIVHPPQLDAGSELLGSISLARFSWPHRRAEVGYWLARQARGQGHATRAARLICDWGFAQLGLERIELQAAAGNRASQRVAERAGFTREALLRCYVRGKRGQQDMVAFGRLAGE
jgi:RimJ/RimL family protein N-acetyltransferase